MKKVKTPIYIFSLLNLFIAYSQNVDFKVSVSEKNYLNSYFLAEKYKVLEDYSESLKFYEKCISINPEESSAYNEIAKIYFSSQEWDNAEYYVKEAIRLDPDKKWYYFLLIDLCVIQNKIEEQLEACNDLIQMDPENYRYYIQKLYVLKELGDHKKAQKFISQIKLKFGQSTELLLEQKAVYISSGDFKSAEDILLTLIKKAPMNTIYFSELAELYMLESNYDQAISAYRKLLEINPNSPDAILALYHIYKNKEDVANQEKYLLMITQNNQISLEKKRDLFYRLLQENNDGENRSFKQIVEKAIVVYPEEPLFNLILGDVYTKESRHKQAIFHYNKSLNSAFVKDEYVYTKLIEIHFLDNDYVSAINKASTALEKYPFSSNLLYYKGLALFNNKDLELALQTLKKGSELVIDNPNFKSNFYALIGDIHHDLKNDKESDLAYEISIKLNPNNVFVLNNYSYYLSLREEKLLLAKQMAEKCNELTKASPKASFLDTYAWVLYKLKEYEEAEINIKQALNLDQESPTLFDHYGDILYANNNINRAINQWKKALELDPNNLSIKKKIQANE
ncbi:tetratricopeptide repeat protein [Flavobacteriales bacterium]|nr:tetratricopeptide repeat protein [Flavobacteriales bacterium]